MQWLKLVILMVTAMLVRELQIFLKVKNMRLGQWNKLRL